MKHFSAQTGGRYTYTDDIENLQSLALAVNAIFDGCDNFIISGCEVTGSSISPGFVYINGEIRRFNGASGQTWPAYLYESNVAETVAYVSGASKVGRVNYGVAIAKTVPSALDQITGEVPQCITISSVGGRQMKDAFFAKYALVLNPASGAQEVEGEVSFKKAVTAKSQLRVEDALSLIKGACARKSYWSGNTLVVEAASENGTFSKMEASAESGIKLYMNGSLVLSASGNGISASNFQSSSVTGGNLCLAGSGINNIAVAEDGVFELNMHGYNGGDDYSRTIKIGDGRGNALFMLSPADKSASLVLPLTIASQGKALTIQDPAHSKTTGDCSIVLDWADMDGTELGLMGYRGNNVLCMKNVVGSIDIVSSDAVNIGPVIKENGVPLTEKYVLQSSFNLEMAKKASNSDIYNRVTSDGRFANLNNGFTQFIDVNGTTQSSLRKQISAVSMAEVVATCPKLTNMLADMAKTESDKEKIRMNIGAAKADSYQEKLNDTGWIKVSGQANVYARQIGNVVSIQGVLLMHDENDGPLFSLPTAISSPVHGVSWRANSYKFGAYINGSSRQCLASCDESKNHGKTTNISLIYFV